MAIKPNDYVIRVEDLITGARKELDIFGREQLVDTYQPYWENFTKHVDAKYQARTRGRYIDYDKIVNEELVQYHAVFKRTKKWKDSYVKFKDPQYFTLFVLQWS